MTSHSDRSLPESIASKILRILKSETLDLLGVTPDDRNVIALFNVCITFRET